MIGRLPRVSAVSGVGRNPEDQLNLKKNVLDRAEYNRLMRLSMSRGEFHPWEPFDPVHPHPSSMMAKPRIGLRRWEKVLPQRDAPWSYLACSPGRRRSCGGACRRRSSRGGRRRPSSRRRSSCRPARSPGSRSNPGGLAASGCEVPDGFMTWTSLSALHGDEGLTVGRVTGAGTRCRRSPRSRGLAGRRCRDSRRGCGCPRRRSPPTCRRA